MNSQSLKPTASASSPIRGQDRDQECMPKMPSTLTSRLAFRNRKTNSLRSQFFIPSAARHSSASRGVCAMNLLFANASAITRYSAAILALTLALGGGLLFPAVASAQAPGQSTFSTPDEAMKALVAAAKDEDHALLQKIFGPEYDNLLSGDPVEDKKDLDDFSAAIQESAQLVQVKATQYTLTAGQDAWPTPIPVVQKDGKWFFDTKAGLEEVLDRRIGENELSAIETCRAYAVAQWEYYTQGDWDHDGVAEYAQHLLSTPGKHDGLYWETAEGDPPSPLGALVAAARAEGYGPQSASPGTAGKGGAAAEDSQPPRAPYHGYYLKILTKQGPHAPGGKFSYLINGNMIAGYALVAYPDKWSNSGVMTFIVNQQGRVYEKNLGADTEKLAAAMTEYDPDASWKLVGAEP
jgi:Protein of unknown function (DUF2950)